MEDNNLNKPDSNVPQPTPVNQPEPQVFTPVNNPSPSPIVDQEPSVVSASFSAPGEPLNSAGPVVSAVDPNLPPEPLPPNRKKKLMYILLPIALIILLGGSAAAFYFGYWTNPSVVWSKTMSNTNDAYNKLIGFVSATPKKTYSGSTIDGNVTVKNGSTSYGGSFHSESDANASQTSIKADLGVTNLDLEAKSILAKNSSEPDIYFQINGIKNLGIGQALGVSDQAINSLDGQWVSIDHTLLDQITSGVIKTKQPPLTKKDIIETANIVGRVNAKYVFTTNKSFSVTKILKNIGHETIDGNSTYHYLVGFNKANVKNYITALRDALKPSPVGVYFEKQTGSSFDSLMGYSDLESSANNINDSDNINVWANANTHLIYKIRISDTTTSNPSENYIDLGLNYKGIGNSYPFFFVYNYNISNQKGNLSILPTYNSSDNSIVTQLLGSFGAYKLNGNIDIKSTNKKITVTAPANSIPLKTAFHDLGLDSEYDSFITSLTSGSSSVGSTPSTSALNSLFQTY